ncbi:hypothetical protein Mal4_45810 [Maioricimonas rarisocia]|uniref:Uncharacterized protein n=1 Tax=Maioricimonas rarisocia TaxID=2528026 RepID=A0A517ZCP0_9PLAN|nr:hypothetical protein [Maioricimonas rarisocia]QDU40225.1 hypothetical protein Mal4_45810 [Maioricimonas rarisocia]
MDLDREHDRRQPWRAAAGLLAFCVATFAGAVVQQAPETILVRAMVATAIVYGLTSLLEAIWNTVSDGSDQ